jgi:hypothetical protein
MERDEQGMPLCHLFFSTLMFSWRLSIQATGVGSDQVNQKGTIGERLCVKDNDWNTNELMIRISTRCKSFVG